eukprot:scaffold1194_cov369-Prasinococcus_capsulatus_cf.AAC.12
MPMGYRRVVRDAQWTATAAVARRLMACPDVMRNNRTNAYQYAGLGSIHRPRQRNFTSSAMVFDIIVASFAARSMKNPCFFPSKRATTDRSCKAYGWLP